MYDRILLPTDGSAEMERVVEHAANLAAAHDATIHALYVVDTASYTSVPLDSSWDTVTGLMHDEGHATLEAVERRIGDRIEVTTSLVEGSPGRAIVEHARANDCDIIVMGTHGRGGIGRILLGSVAERVVRTATVPVLTVRVSKSLRTPEVEAGREPAK